MDLVGQVVTHKAFGEGVVCQQDDGHVMVEFAQGTKRFVYPDAFERFLVLEDPAAQAAVASDLAAVAPLRAARDSLRVRAADPKPAEVPAKAPAKASAGTSTGASTPSRVSAATAPAAARPTAKKPAATKGNPATRPGTPATGASKKVAQAGAKPTRARASRSVVTTVRTTVPTRTATRVAGRPVAFVAYQGNTLGNRTGYGYLWAPTQERDGSSRLSWDLLQDVRPGDLVLFLAEGKLVAVGRAVGTCFETTDLDAARTLHRPGVRGRRVDCTCALLDQPVEAIEFLDDILELGCGERAPFDEQGNERDGYLYELDPRLAHALLEGMAAANPTLARQGFVRRYLAGE